MNILKVRNMRSSNGNEVPNQFIIITREGEYFQSYDSVIAYIQNGSHSNVLLDREAWDYSKTTGKYRNQFLGEGIAETRKKIADGTYKLTNLNA